MHLYVGFHFGRVHIDPPPPGVDFSCHFHVVGVSQECAGVYFFQRHLHIVQLVVYVIEAVK